MVRGRVGRLDCMILGIVLLTTMALVLALAPSAAQAVGDFLVIRDPVVSADAVIAISGDGTGERVATAVTLLRRGNARWLILSGSTAGRAPGGATAAMRRVALRAGIPEDRIFIDDQSSKTLDNARNSARIMQAHSMRGAILVTSPYHSRRAAWTFRSEFLPRGLDVRVVAAYDSFFTVKAWWTRKRDRDLVIREYAKLLVFLVGIR